MPPPNLKEIKAAIDRTLATQQQRKAIISENDRSNIVAAVSGAIAPMLTPYLQAMVEASRKAGQDNKEVMREAMAVLREELSDSLKGLKLDGITADVRMPDIVIPDIKVPDIHVPQAIVNVTAPKLDVLDVIRKIQFPDEMNIKGFVQLQGVSLQNPLPVQIRDANGKPVSFGDVTQIIGGGSSGKADYFTIKGFRQSAFSEITNPDGRLKVELPTGSSGLTDTELRASSVPVEQVSGSSWSVTVNGTVPVSAGSTLTVDQLSGATWSVAGTVVVSSITASVAAALIDSGGVQYSTSNPLPTTIVSGALTSVISTGPTAADSVDDGSAPVQVGGIARTANPTAVAANDVVKSTHDDLGRQVMRPIQVRDLIRTAYVSVANGTETTLRAAVVGSYLDCIAVMGSNNSDAAVSVDIRAVTAGSIVHTLRIPANGTAGWAPHVPWPQDETGNNWTVDGPDETGRTLTFSGLFSQEV